MSPAAIVVFRLPVLAALLNLALASGGCASRPEGVPCRCVDWYCDEHIYCKEGEICVDDDDDDPAAPSGPDCVPASPTTGRRISTDVQEPEAPDATSLDVSTETGG